MGAGNRSAIGTLVERSTRYLILLAFLDGVASTEGVRHAITAALAGQPAGLRRTLTWDQGKELALHPQITAATGTSVFFCDAHSPWQRGSNENMNGLLRDYFPKGTDLSIHTAEDVGADRRRGQRPATQDTRLAAPSRAVRRRGHGRLTGDRRGRARAQGSTPARPSGLASVEPCARQLHHSRPRLSGRTAPPSPPHGSSALPCRHPLGLRSQRSSVATFADFPTVAWGQFKPSFLHGSSHR